MKHILILLGTWPLVPLAAAESHHPDVLAIPADLENPAITPGEPPPISPPSGPIHWLFQGPPAENKFLAGTLFGEGVKTRIKEALLSECNLHTNVRLPNGVFAPYTSIRTNLLFFTKGTPTKEVWYYEHPYPTGAKSYNKGKPISIAEFEAEKQWWGKPDKHGHYSKREENERAWRVSIDQIKAGNFNLDLKNPHNSDEGPGDVDHLLPEYEKLLAQIADTRAALKKELHHALTR